jgi:hypothetical protein
MSWLSSMLYGDKVQVSNQDYGQYDKMTNDFINPFSSGNQNMLSSMKNASTDTVAQMGLNNQRQSAMGQNPFADQQNKQQLSSITSSLGSNWNNWMSQATQTGAGLVQNKMNMQLQRDIANANLRQQREQAKTEFFGGLLAQLAPIAGQAVGMGGGFLSMLGGNGSANPVGRTSGTNFFNAMGR